MIVLEIQKYDRFFKENEFRFTLVRFNFFFNFYISFKSGVQCKQLNIAVFFYNYPLFNNIMLAL